MMKNLNINEKIKFLKIGVWKSLACHEYVA